MKRARIRGGCVDFDVEKEKLRAEEERRRREREEEAEARRAREEDGRRRKEEAERREEARREEARRYKHALLRRLERVVVEEEMRARPIDEMNEFDDCHTRHEDLTSVLTAHEELRRLSSADEDLYRSTLEELKMDNARGRVVERASWPRIVCLDRGTYHDVSSASFSSSQASEVLERAWTASRVLEADVCVSFGMWERTVVRVSPECSFQTGFNS